MTTGQSLQIDAVGQHEPLVVARHEILLSR